MIQRNMEDGKKTEQNSKYPSQYEELHYQKYHRGCAEYDYDNDYYDRRRKRGFLSNIST